MIFSEFEKIMASAGIKSLAEIARFLNTTPQAVSNWKSRNQVPNHIVIKISNLQTTEALIFDHQGSQNSQFFSANRSISGTNQLASLSAPKDLTLSDILLILAEQLKIIILITFLSSFLSFTYIQMIIEPQYVSTASVLLPGGNNSSNGLSNIAAQLGVNPESSDPVDLSNPELFPKLLDSRIFTESLIRLEFLDEKINKKLSLFEILNDSQEANLDDEKTILSAKSMLNNMISLETEGVLSYLSVKSTNPTLSRDLNKAVIEQLQILNRKFKSQHVIEKNNFIKSRINAVSDELQKSESNLKIFREKNRQIAASPSLMLEEERLTRIVEIQKGVYLTLKQQLELAKIEEVQKSSIIQILDEPQVPLYPSNKELKLSLILSMIFGLILGIVMAFFRNYFNSEDLIKRRKHKRTKSFLINKSKEFLFDYKITGTLTLFFIAFLPFYLNYESQNPIFFDRYSHNLVVLIILYFLILFLFLSLFLYSFKKNR